MFGTFVCYLYSCFPSQSGRSSLQAAKQAREASRKAKVMSLPVSSSNPQQVTKTSTAVTVEEQPVDQPATNRSVAEQLPMKVLQSH